MKEFIYKPGPCEYGKSKGIYGVVVVEGRSEEEAKSGNWWWGQGGKDLPRNFFEVSEL